MLDEIIKELAASNTDDQITSEGMLAWAKRVEAKRAQAAVLNTIMESRQFDKVQIIKRQKRTTQGIHQGQQHNGTHADIVAGYMC